MSWLGMMELRPTMSFPNTLPIKPVSLSLHVSTFSSRFDPVAHLAASQQTAGSAVATGLAPGILASVSPKTRSVRVNRY
jgi:hypothetical protein